MGCIARLGCLILLVLLGCIGWFTRSMWLPERFRPHTTAVVSGRWQAATPAGSERARAAIARLSQPKGPVFESLAAGDLASLAASEITSRVGGSADSVAARVDADRLTVRARVDFASLRDKLGPLASMMHDKEMVELSGNFHMLQPGLGEF